MSLQKYFSLLYHDEGFKALKLFKDEVTLYLNNDIFEVEKLVSLLFWINDKDKLNEKLFASGFIKEEKDILLELNKLIPKCQITSSKRLEILLTQAKVFQNMLCPYHFSSSYDDQFLVLKEQSLFYDHQCEKRSLFTKKLISLLDHEDEIWFTVFNPDSSLLLTTSRDQKAIIWNTTV